MELISHRRDGVCSRGTPWLRVMLLLALPALAQLPPAAGVAGVVVVDGERYPRTDAGIAAAIASLHGPGQVVLPVGVYEIAREIVIDVPGISILGMGYGSRLEASNPTANLFRVTGPLFQLANVEIQSAIEHTAGSVVKIESEQGSVHHVRLNGNFYNGFTLDSHRAGGWSFDEIRLVGGTSWNAAFVLRSESATIASTHLHDIFISNAVHWKSASIVLDTGVDTFICSDAELGPVRGAQFAAAARRRAGFASPTASSKPGMRERWEAPRCRSTPCATCATRATSPVRNTALWWAPGRGEFRFRRASLSTSAARR